MSTDAHPPGWYVDPTEGSHYRWWDGRAWTEHLYPTTPLVTSPPGGSGSAQAQPTVPSASPVSGTAVATAPGGEPSGPRWGLIVVAVVAGFIVVIGIAMAAVMLMRAVTPVDGPIALPSPIETPSETAGDDPTDAPASPTEVPSLAEIEGQPTVDGASLSPADGATDGVDPDAGQPVPMVVGTDFSGSTVTIGGGGTPQLVLMVAGWCPSCQVQLPTTAEWMRDSPRDDVEVVLVVTWLDPDRPNWPPSDWLEREGFDGQVLVDDGHNSVSQAYGANATPFWVVIDRDGNLVERQAGQLDVAGIEALAAAVDRAG